MKSQFQTLSFLSHYRPKTYIDADFINAFLDKKFNITPKTPRFAPNFDSKSINVESFIRWFESVAAAFKIGRFKNQTVLLGDCTLETCEIIGTLTPEGTVSTETITVLSQEIEEATPEETNVFQEALRKSNLQPHPATLRLIPKYTPKIGERVVFYNFAMDVQGVGVVRSVSEAGNVTFFCYFTYPSKTVPKQIGYSLEEDPGYDLNSFVYENIDTENIPTSLGNSTSCFRRLGNELGKVGKVWKDKLHRIEPLQVEVPVGSSYYYISDKMKVVAEREKGTPTSHLRYLSGNYFTSQKAADRMLGKFKDILRDYLASDTWPELDD